MLKVQIEMEIKKVFNQMQITLDNEEWVRLHQQYLQLKKQLEKLAQGVVIAPKACYNNNVIRNS